MKERKVKILKIIFMFSITFLFLPLYLYSEFEKTYGKISDSGSITVTADYMKYNGNVNEAIFSGNVVVTGANFKLTCGEMVVKIEGGEIKGIIATKNPKIYQNGSFASAERIEYILKMDAIQLTGNVLIVRQDDILKASKAVYYLCKDTFQCENAEVYFKSNSAGNLGTGIEKVMKGR